ncbi:MAG: 50S ribosomal protein L24 [Elusimicrobiota bacterium]
MIIIKKKDKVKIVSGEDRGKVGEVLKVIPEENRIIIAKINMVKRHLRRSQNDPGGIREKEAPVHISNVMLVCPKCEQPSRPKIDKMSDGKKVRICRKCNEMIM